MQQNEFQTNGHKKNHLLQIRLDLEQKQRLEALASANGFKNLSDFCRHELLNPDLHFKLNSILNLLQENKEKGKEKNGITNIKKI